MIEPGRYQFADGRQLLQLKDGADGRQRFALLTIDGKPLGYLVAEHVELPSRLPGDLAAVTRKAKQ